MDAVRHCDADGAEPAALRAALYAEPLFPGVDDPFLDLQRRRARAVQRKLIEGLLGEAVRCREPMEISRRAAELLELDPENDARAAAVAALERAGRTVNGTIDPRVVLQPIVDCGPELRGPNAARRFPDLERRIGDVRWALDVAIVRRADVELGVAALAALSRFFFDRGLAREAFGWYEVAIPLLRSPSPLRSEALYLRALVGRNLGRFEHNLPAFEEAIAALEARGDRSTLAKALLYASNAARMAGRPSYATDLATRGLAILQASDDRYLVAFAHSALGAAAYARGEFETAMEEFERAHDGFSTAGAPDDEALMAINAARCRFALGEAGDAEREFLQAREAVLQSSNRYVEAHAEVSLALVAIDRGDAEAAAPHAARGAKIALDLDDLELALIALEASAEVYALAGEFGRARDALAAADGVRAEFLVTRPPSDSRRAERLRAALADRGFPVTGAVVNPAVMMRSLLAGTVRAYARAGSPPLA